MERLDLVLGKINEIDFLEKAVSREDGSKPKTLKQFKMKDLVEVINTAIVEGFKDACVHAVNFTNTSSIVVNCGGADIIDRDDMRDFLYKCSVKLGIDKFDHNEAPLKNGLYGRFRESCFNLNNSKKKE